MSIESLTTGDIVIRQTATTTRGESGGQVQVWSDAGRLDCMIQTASAGETLRYDAQGMRLTHWGFFSVDPGLTKNDRLLWVTKAGRALSNPIYLKVLDCYAEGRPGEDLLWVADLEQETTRSE